MGKTRRGWYEREEITKVTKDWIATNVRLTQREQNLLPLIYDRKLVRRDHLEIISEDYRNLGDSRTKILNRSISKLFRTVVLDKVHEAQMIGSGNHPCTVAIDKGGSLILNVVHKPRILHKKEYYKGELFIKRSLPVNYKHINGVNRMEVDAIEFCKNTGNHILKWKLEESKTFKFNGEKITLITDVFLEMLINGKLFLAYLEYDTGSENARYKDNFPTLDNKLLNYRMYFRSKLWINKLEYFPMVLLITEDEKRVKYFTKECKKKGLHGYGIYYNRFVSFLERLEALLDK